MDGCGLEEGSGLSSAGAAEAEPSGSVAIRLANIGCFLKSDIATAGWRTAATSTG